MYLGANRATHEHVAVKIMHENVSLSDVQDEAIFMDQIPEHVGILDIRGAGYLHTADGEERVFIASERYIYS